MLEFGPQGVHGPEGFKEPVTGVTGSGDRTVTGATPGDTGSTQVWQVVPPIYRFQMEFLMTLQRC